MVASGGDCLEPAGECRHLAALCRARLLPLLLLHVQVVLPVVVCRRLGWFAIVRCYLHC